MPTPRHLLLAVTLLPLALPAQLQGTITYVDADTATNTTRADGTPYTPVASTSGSDNEWALRAFGNGATVLTSHDTTGNEDCPMLRTTITGLIPTFAYHVYSYHWSDGQAWRGRGLVSSTQPNPPLPGFNTVHFGSSVFAPMQPLLLGTPVGALQTSLNLQFDAAGFEQEGHFTQAILVREGNRWLYELWLGVHHADLNGEIHVYVDDLEGQQTGAARTWYDGVGYALAPIAGATGCGLAPAIGFRGAPIQTTSFTATMTGGPANALAICSIGLGNTSWNGLPLPFSLANAGFPGCLLEVSADVVLFGLTDAAGGAAFSLTIPPSSPLDLYWQLGGLDPANVLSLTGVLATTFRR